MMVEALIEKLDHFAKLVECFDPATGDGRELILFRKALLAEMKEISFASKTQQEEVWDHYRGIANKFHEKMEAASQEQESFAEEAHRRVADFAAAVNKLEVGSQEKSREVFTRLRSQADGLVEFIKQPHWPDKLTRNKTWDEFIKVRECLRTLEDVYYTALKEEREKKASQSERITLLFMQALRTLSTDDACLSAKSLDELVTNLRESNLTLTVAEKKDELECQRNPLKTQSEILRDIRNLAIELQNTFTWEHRKQLFAAIDNCKKVQDEAWEAYKAEARKKKEEREQRKTEWVQKQNNFLHMLKERLGKQHQYKEKLDKFSISQKEFLVKLESRLGNQQDFLVKLYDDIDELQKQFDEAWSASFKERTEARIEGKKQKIEEVEREMEEIKDKIREVEINIAGLPSRIDEVSRSIEEITLKIEEVDSKLGKNKIDADPAS